MMLRLMLRGASALALALLISVSNQTAVSAQQNQDMPYDLHFIDMMIMHHQEGIEMAQLAQTKAVKANVKAFATNAVAEQQKDIEELQAHRNHWYAGKPIMDHGNDAEHAWRHEDGYGRHAPQATCVARFSVRPSVARNDDSSSPDGYRYGQGGDRESRTSGTQGIRAQGCCKAASRDH